MSQMRESLATFLQGSKGKDEARVPKPALDAVL